MAREKTPEEQTTDNERKQLVEEKKKLKKEQQAQRKEAKRRAKEIAKQVHSPCGDRRSYRDRARKEHREA